MTVHRGTDSHMAPEVRRGGDATLSADIWSFGVLLWELHYLRAPGDNDAAGFNHVPIIRSDCEGPWAAVIRRCLKIRPRDRPTARELMEELLLLQ